MALTGRCLCGNIRYELDGELPPLVNCHCHFCRRAHGAAFVTIAWVRRSSLHIRSGEDLLRRYEIGEGFRGFCGSCGTRIFNGLITNDGYATLIVSTLDECPKRGPVMHINIESKADWLVIQDDLPQYDTRPTDIAAAFRGIHEAV